MRQYKALFFVSYIFYLTSQGSVAQHSITQSISDTRSMGSGNCGVAFSNPVNFINNTAYLGLIQESGFYTNYSSYFLIQGISQINIQGIYSNSNSSGWGLHLSRDGSKEWNENLIGIAYSRKVSTHSSIGIQLNAIQRQQIESGNSTTLSPSIGALFQIIPNLILATQINNPIPIQKNNRPIVNSQFKFGLNYKVYQQLNFLTEFNASQNITTFIQFGLEYKPMDRLSFRTGYVSNGLITAGFSVVVKNKLNLELGYSLHPVLNNSAGLGLSYYFNKK
ncbi:MAG: hypothetical protein HOP11_08275 [Saprospiraceae bacterium]|nr:hypothetical protein [Saprospiraceae bacterium]